MAQTLEITMEVRITDDIIDDILSGSLEGGSGYWVETADVSKEDRAKVPTGTPLSEFLTHGASAINLYYKEDETKDTLTKLELTKDKVYEGIKLFFAKNPRVSKGLLYRNSDEQAFWELDTCKMDATDCDCVIQYAVFGEIVFG